MENTPPAKGHFWRTFAAVAILKISGSQKTVLGCLVDHANPKNGLCYPSEALIAAETGLPIRTVERAVADLLLTPYLSRKRRNQSSNIYSINFDALLEAWDDYKGRGAAYRLRRENGCATDAEDKRPSQKWRINPSKFTDRPVKCDGSMPSEVADE
jgi:hypothetical protein